MMISPCDKILSLLAKASLVLAFASAGALSTVLIWVLFSLASPEPFAIDSLRFPYMAAGAIGPILSWLLVRRLTRATRATLKRTLRVTSTVGFIAILIVELLYLIPLGILTMAYQGVEM